MMSSRRMLSHAIAVFVGVYIGLLLSSQLHFSSRALPIQEFHQAPLSDYKDMAKHTNETRQQEEKAARAHPAFDKNAITHAVHHPICQQFASPIPSALDYWTRHVQKIHAATQLTPYDIKWHFHDYTAQLLLLISPRLPHSVLSVPHDWSVVQHILTKAYARYQYLQDPSNKPYVEPVKMVILGGSVLVGRNCRKLMKDLGIQGMLLPNRACTWAYRLQIFFNQVFGMEDVVQITKISMGGTNSAVGAQMFVYALLPEAAREPDIVLNAYSTNDMHILTVLEAQSGNQTLRDRVLHITQEFVRAVMERRPCQTNKPLLLHIDDYLGNEQREIWSTTELSQGVQVLAHYYGFASMSYANVVRQWVYGDTRETWFSPEGWYIKGKMEREIHPGMGMHITATWVVAYNLLNLVTTYCSLEPWLQHSSQDSMDYSKSFLAKTVPLNGYLSNVPGKPKVPPQNLPPLLTPTLSLETISDDWRAAEERERADLEGTDCSDQGLSRCIFSWVSGMSQQYNNKTWIEEYFGAKQVENKGWKLVDDGGKLGYSPSAIGDEAMLEFQLSQDIRTVTFLMLKSYGPKWENSKIRVIIEGRSSNTSEWKDLASHDLVGIHDKQTSEVYTKEIGVTSEARKGSSLRVRYRLESGETFKIMGLAVCS